MKLIKISKTGSSSVISTGGSQQEYVRRAQSEKLRHPEFIYQVVNPQGAVVFSI